MSRRRGEAARLLRWYPPAWRERYGDELVALMEDQLGGRRPSLRFMLATAWAGLRERVHHADLVGNQPPAERIRAGSLLILCAWTAFVLAGASFSKVSEHFSQVIPASARRVPEDSFRVVAALAIIAMALVVVGALSALPAFGRLVRSGGFSPLRAHLLRAAVLTVVTVGAVLTLSSWAHHLNHYQRNGGDGIYSEAVGLWALLVAATLAQWTTFGVATARRIDLTRRVLRLEAALAIAVAGAMATMTAAAALWWGAMAEHAPWFLQGTRPGTSPSPFSLQLVLTLALMATAVLSAGFGVVRIARPLRDLGAR